MPTPSPTPSGTQSPGYGTGVDGFINALNAQLGKPYVLGGNGPDYFDCSGLVYYCLKQVGVNVGRLSAAGYSGYNGWECITNYNDLRRGDLIFYHNDSGAITHVAVYLGNGYYIHASSSQGCVCISDFGYWSQTHFSCGRRVFN